VFAARKIILNLRYNKVPVKHLDRALLAKFALFVDVLCEESGFDENALSNLAIQHNHKLCSSAHHRSQLFKVGGKMCQAANFPLSQMKSNLSQRAVASMLLPPALP
jgi:hypothetical protein